MTTNHQRQRAEIVLQAFISGMKGEGVTRATIIRTLFDYVIHELGVTPEGGEVPSVVEDAENTAILNEIDAYWMGIRHKIEEECPDTFVIRP